MIALSRVGHFDLACQDGLTGVTPIQPEVVSLRRSGNVFFDSRTTERQVVSAVEKLGHPARNFGGECAFIDRHWQLETRE